MCKKPFDKLICTQYFDLYRCCCSTLMEREAPQQKALWTKAEVQQPSQGRSQISKAMRPPNQQARLKAMPLAHSPHLLPKVFTDSTALIIFSKAHNQQGARNNVCHTMEFLCPSAWKFLLKSGPTFSDLSRSDQSKLEQVCKSAQCHCCAR